MTDVAERDWRLIRDHARDGPTQMALEEVAIRTAVEDDRRTVRVFTWEPSTLSMGYRQEPESVDWAFCEREGIDVTRRQTGGGGIYHDEYADISYTVVAPAEELPGDLMESYAFLCEPIVEALRTMGVDAAFAADEYPSIHEPSCYLRGIHPAHDVLADGRKISGNAQYRQRDAIIQHGSISYDLRPAQHVGVFEGADVSMETFRDRVTSIQREAGIDREEAVRTLEEALANWCDAEEGEWHRSELDAANALAETKYANDAWILDREVTAPSSL